MKTWVLELEMQDNFHAGKCVDCPLLQTIYNSKNPYDYPYDICPVAEDSDECPLKKKE